MTSAILSLQLVLLSVFLVPVSVLLVQVIGATIPRKPERKTNALRPRLAVLIPAHNESNGILATLESVFPQLLPDDRVLVVADNCSDDTAKISAGRGAEVVERQDALRRGKGFALDFGIRFLERDPPELVIVLDGDCEMTAGSVDRLGRLSASTGRPVQAIDLMIPPKKAGVTMQISEFAWTVKNLVRPLGFLRLGLPCQLMGTGMALPWGLICSIRLASGHLVEDMQMGVDCARAGLPPLFCPEALVQSYFPSTEDAIRSQRTRWEHGHLAMIAGELPKLLWQSLTGVGSGLLPMTLDLCVPPLSLLLLIVLALVAASTVLAFATGLWIPLAMAAGELAMFTIALVVAWRRFGSESVTPGELMRAVPYMLGKLPLYFKFLVRRQVDWVKSKRDGD
jgi:cellulose synthase/poly-beta-1,6-N-acetylglucosamine synthase-like glycosyltransferase